MKIVFYCQHIWGVGHFFRALEICRALKGNDVILVTGGAPLNHALPEGVRSVQLPGLMTDRSYQGLHPVDPTRSVEAVRRERRRLLHAVFTEERPDCFLIEFYPFGRKAFRFELDPILEGIRSRRLHCSKVICSLRDILVEKRDSAAYERRVVDILNRYFDLLLVHADPAVVPLNLTFSCMHQIDIPVVYTGYVAAPPAPKAGKSLRTELRIQPEEALVVASAGGGKAAIVLMAPLIEGFSRHLAARSYHLHAFTGPYMPADEFKVLTSHAGSRIAVERFTSRFPDYLDAADLSVSMGGYNTVMNLLAGRVPALVWPYPGDREQGLRAARLAASGALRVISDRDLKPERLADLVRKRLKEREPQPHRVDLSGAPTTARRIRECVGLES